MIETTTPVSYAGRGSVLYAADFSAAPAVGTPGSELKICPRHIFFTLRQSAAARVLLPFLKRCKLLGYCMIETTTPVSYAGRGLCVYTGLGG